LPRGFFGDALQAKAVKPIVEDQILEPEGKAKAIAIAGSKDNRTGLLASLADCQPGKKKTPPVFRAPMFVSSSVRRILSTKLADRASISG
jgi:hypothetical protein